MEYDKWREIDDNFGKQDDDAKNEIWDLSDRLVSGRGKVEDITEAMERVFAEWDLMNDKRDAHYKLLEITT